ncbi:glycoside hydrolase family 26 protein [Streptomyces sp. NPDC014870]|uniref:glycoside hydrolase family 26 protein n=1 Tax=Streptomyces sp. NPDC014870 TaxID=3364925 RepID=UPI0036F999AF
MTRGHAAPPPRRAPMMAIALAAVGALAAALGVWSTQGSDDRCRPDRKLVLPCDGAWWGAYIPYDEDSSLTRPVYAFERKIGRKLDVIYTYHDMSGNPTDGELLTPDEVELGEDRLLMLAWESTVWKEKHHANWSETQLGWKNIASGKYDTSIIDPQARRLKAYGKRVFFSFDQETDMRIKEGAGTPEEYVAAYRHLRDRFERLGVRNVVWVWTVSGYLGNADLMKALYPGDRYVDWIGMDQYNYYQCHKSPNWLDFESSQRPTYDWLRTNISANKPIMLAEFATAPDPTRPDRQRDWYTAIPRVAPTLPRAKAYVHWNRPVPGGPACDLTVNSGPALDGYRSAGLDPYFRRGVAGR